MKLLAALLLIGATSAPALAGPATGYRSRGGYAEQEKCYRREYREEYKFAKGVSLTGTPQKID